MQKYLDFAAVLKPMLSGFEEFIPADSNKFFEV